jgi:hypothetical protein
MRTWTSILLMAVLVLAGAPGTGAQSTSNERRVLRDRLADHYDFVALSDGLALRPRAREGDVRLIEVTGGAVLINGVAVTGRELRERLGGDGETILKLSYLTSAELRELGSEEPGREPHGATQPAEPPPLERAQPQSSREDTRERAHRSHGDRIRIFGDVAVEQDEEISGQAVAVFGSVRVHGKVDDQVVAVFGSVLLGPEAVVGGDVVSVGGRVFRDPKAQARGGVTEVALNQTTWPVQIGPWNTWDDVPRFMPFGAVPRLFGTALRLSLLLLMSGIALVAARRAVEASAERVSHNPLKVTIVGLVAELLALPVLILTAVVLSISIIGIPLLLLLPFVVLGLILMALVGFTGTAAAVGRFAQRRVAPGHQADYVAVLVGVLVILSPVLIGRLLALVGWPMSPLVFVLVGIGFLIELLAWASGFGAMLMNAFARWQARRAGAIAVA